MFTIIIEKGRIYQSDSYVRTNQNRQERPNILKDDKGTRQTLRSLRRHPKKV